MKQRKLTKKQLRAMFAKLNAGDISRYRTANTIEIRPEDSQEMARKSNVLLEARKGDVTIRLLKEHPADVGAYRLPRIVKETYLPLKADELRFLAQKRIRK